MSTTGDVKVTEGAGKAVATYTITEDSETKSLQRIVLCDTTGAEIGSTISANAASTTPSPVEVGPFSVKNIAASQTNAVVGATGAVGDYLSHIIIQPASTSPGVVTILDGSAGTTIYSFPGGATSLSNLAPLILALPAKCVNAGWHITTGANVSVTAVGTFT